MFQDFVFQPQFLLPQPFNPPTIYPNMRTLFSILVTLAWALWLGGLVTLFLTVVTLFRFDRTIAIQTAPQVFLMWERYQLALAACALVTSFALRLLTKSTLSSVDLVSKRRAKL